jgi:hypothetical protein
MTRQLNVRSDHAYETARRLAQRLGTSTTSVVETALDRLDRDTFKVPTYEDLTSEQRARADRLLALARAGRDEGDPAASSDHGWMYDESGLPK